jgi:hypothetical protein
MQSPTMFQFAWLLEYGKVLKMLGNGRLEAYCYDGISRLCHIRGKMRKQVWVAVVRSQVGHALIGLLFVVLLFVC